MPIPILIKTQLRISINLYSVFPFTSHSQKKREASDVHDKNLRSRM